MNRWELYQKRKKWFSNNWVYELTYYKDFDYTILDNVMYKKRRGRGSNKSYNDIILMADTETSKKHVNHSDQNGKMEPVENHVVAWTISARAFEQNLFTLYGNKPSEFIECIQKMLEQMHGEDTFLYFHNYSYDYIFIRKFLFKAFGEPEKQLNTKPHYPIYMTFSNGLIIRDSLILAQRKLEKWAKDMEVEHKKAVGLWNYDLIRDQNCKFSDDELKYIEYDTLSGVECIQKTLEVLNKDIASIPYTATGIPREEVRNRGKLHNGHNYFLRVAMTWDQQRIAELTYHGGYTHGNRHLIEEVIVALVQCYDFASSYPYVMLSEKYPCEKFHLRKDCSIQHIIENSDNYAYMFELVLVNVCLKSDDYVMPALQYSKAIQVINPVIDNGRIISADYVSIYITEQDLMVINEQYDYENHICRNVNVSLKDYLPRWFTDYIYELFEAKCKLKHSDDKVAYNMAKAKLNSCYGMCVQKPVKDNIDEDYVTGEFIVNEVDSEEEYERYCKRINTVLPYQVGVWVTAYAFKNLHKLGKCCETWIYSDTDSCYGIGWNDYLIQAYNEICEEKLQSNGYEPVYVNGEKFSLGVATLDGEYSEFKVLGAKRYCGRSTADGQLHITVAGVPKNGAKCLNDDINNFTAGFIFPGTQTGKKTHMYIYNENIYIDENGNETGDSIDLMPCDYLLDSVNIPSWNDIFYEEIQIQTYEEE